VKFEEKKSAGCAVRSLKLVILGDGGLKNHQPTENSFRGPGGASPSRLKVGGSDGVRCAANINCARRASSIRKPQSDEG